MSTQGAREYRPKIHYSPETGWINDPNGLVHEAGTYHLFAQHYPHDTRWGPMHWIHATSEDLLHWQPRGIALSPDEKLGLIFSGSAIIDAGNTSGLGDGVDPMIAVFTHHGETAQQSIASSSDRIAFTQYAGNPVIPNPGLKDFRDPKVFRNDLLNCWSMVLAAGDRVEFYASDDLIAWRKTGEFGAAENLAGGVFECPDLFPLAAPDGSTHWALIASMTGPAEQGGSRTQYFLGEFDGRAFRQHRSFGEVRRIDAGYDNYAAVSFNGAPERLMMGWAASWVYAADTPTGPYCGSMTLARRPMLIDAGRGLRLAFAPVLPAAPGLYPIGSGAALPGETFHLTLRAAGAFEARLVNDRGECLRFGLADGQLYVDRSRAGERAFNRFYDSDLYQATRRPREGDGAMEMELVFDVCIAELFAPREGYAHTALVYPTRPYAWLELDGDASCAIRPLA
ncbi:MAG: glycoside hydrolase family 32 protein [Clostridiales bacterium]|nr:glycoside hydrolase family 32 protein [Clostridiales bacterium]